jgi:hypothetical protein
MTMASSPRFDETPQTEPPLAIFVEMPEGKMLSADAVSRLIMDPSRAFQEYFAAEIGPGEVTFVVQRVRTGSIDLQMLPALIQDGIEVVTGFASLYGAGKVMAGFMTHLSDLFGLAAQGENIGPLNLAKVMLANMADLVARGLAISITINIAGVNTPIEINRRNARSIQDGVAKARANPKPEHPEFVAGDASRRVGVDGRIIAADLDLIEPDQPEDIRIAGVDDVEGGFVDPYLRDEDGNTIPDEEGNPLPAGAAPPNIRRRRKGTPQLHRAPNDVAPNISPDAIGRASMQGADYGGSPELQRVSMYLEADAEKLSGRATRTADGWVIDQLNGRNVTPMPVAAGAQLIASNRNDAKVEGRVLRLSNQPIAFAVDVVSGQTF